MALEILLTDLTAGTVTGTGIFDKLMASTKAHLEAEYAKGRIKGPEYATVYLGALDNVMSNSLQFLLQKAAIGLQADLLAQQILLAQVEVTKATAAVALMEAQTAHTIKQTLVIDQEILIKQQQVLVSIEEVLVKRQQVLVSQAEVAIAQAKLVNIPKEGALIDAQKAQAIQNTLNLASEKLGIEARTTLTVQQKANAVIEGTVLVAQECKLRAEYDLILNNNLKVTAEIGLLSQKGATERAQTTSLGVDVDSVVGRQKALYLAQTEGFARDAEQKAAKLLVDTWNVRRTTDEGTVADGINMLNDATVGRAVSKVLTGVGA